jgi:signal transduction histidine kinase
VVQREPLPERGDELVTTLTTTVLIIDDDPNLRKTLSDILRAKGYRTLSAKDGAEGLALIGANAVDLALIDLKLPDISGLEVTRRIKVEYPGIEAIILTGNASLDSAIKATNIGAFSYLQKPYDIEQLLLHIRHATEKQESGKKIREYQEHLEELVRERTKELESANRAKTDFLANTSHELRTPLNAVIGFSSILLDGLDGELSDQQREHLRDILESGRRLHAIVEGMLAVAQTENGSLVLDPSRFPLREALDAALLSVEEVAQRSSIAVRLDLAPETDVEIEADRDKLEQIVGNLLDNGIKFTPAGGTVLVRAQLDRESVEIAVEDTGIGIRAEDLVRLFQPFCQLEAPLTKTYAGAGLGLVLTKRLVELHGGRIRVESAPGAGSRFIVTLPLRRPVTGGTTGS